MQFTAHHRHITQDTAIPSPNGSYIECLLTTTLDTFYDRGSDDDTRNAAMEMLGKILDASILVVKHRVNPECSFFVVQRQHVCQTTIQ